MNITGYYNTGDGHQLAYYEFGNREMPPILFLHGGPGGHISEAIKDYFNLDAWHVIAFDQRGCGNSIPFASCENNTPQHAVADIEGLRMLLKVKKWTVFGGSYGSTLALMYAISFPNNVNRLILRGIFLGRQEDILWLYQEGASYFYPTEHEYFKALIPVEAQGTLVKAYSDYLNHPDPNIVREAAKRWSYWESSLVNLIPMKQSKTSITDYDLSIAKLECHFFVNEMFWEDDNDILDHIDAIKEIPTYIVHGRYDVDCRLSGAIDLYNQLDFAYLYIVEGAGHSGFDGEMKKTLSAILSSLETQNVYYVEQISEKEDINSKPHVPIDTILWESKHPVPAEAYVALCPEGLRVSMRAYESNPLTTVTCDQGPVYQDSALEFFVSFNNACYANFEINSFGSLLAHYGTKGNRIKADTNNLALIHRKIDVDDTKWSVTLTIPFGYFESIGMPYDSENMTFNVYKISEDHQHMHFQSFHPVLAETPDFHRPEDFIQAIIIK